MGVRRLRVRNRYCSAASFSASSCNGGCAHTASPLFSFALALQASSPSCFFASPIRTLRRRTTGDALSPRRCSPSTHTCCGPADGYTASQVGEAHPLCTFSLILFARCNVLDYFVLRRQLPVQHSLSPADVLDLHNWTVAHVDAHPAFERVPDAELASDPCVEIMRTYTEEGKKVERLAGDKYIAVFRRLTPVEAESKANTLDFWTEPTVLYEFQPSLTTMGPSVAGLLEAVPGMGRTKRVKLDTGAWATSLTAEQLANIGKVTAAQAVTTLPLPSAAESAALSLLQSSATSSSSSLDAAPVIAPLDDR